MDVKQILILGLCLVPVWSRCFNESEVSEKAEKRLETLRLKSTQSPAAVASDTPAVCPMKLYLDQSKALENRSLSPWRYVLVTREDHFPSTYTEAQCLCSGCVMIKYKKNGSPEVVESHDYNSVPIVQTRLFLKKELCSKPNGQRKYQLTPVYEKVVVGCTCARANTPS